MGVLVRTLDCAVDDGRLGRHERYRVRVVVGYAERGYFGGSGRCRAHGLGGPHATLVGLRVPQSVAALEHSVQTWQTVVIDVTIVRIRVVAFGVPKQSNETTIKNLIIIII